MKLESLGELSTDDPIAKYLPKVPFPPAVRPLKSKTLAQLRGIWESEQARKIMDEIVSGESTTLAAVMQERIPRSWPDMVVTRIWPDHLKQWGHLLGLRDLGAAAGRSGVQVWVGLDHERGERAVKIVFNERRLGILDLKAGPYPVTRHYAQVSRDRFESHGFSAEARPVLEWNGGRTLTVGGVSFHPARD